ncbi:hypothetical protein P148_SR1C00001G0902 [candidate division SR1 bacterium RAAC1_SR1_1]|nr:hypothetical protein P148_SR1C00001G0902 [candidate division SR1 bacterium RAAC1_SR1_1]
MSFDLQGLDPIQAPNQQMPSTTNFGAKPEKAKNLFNEPGNLSGRELVGKAGIGLIIGGVIAALLFIVTTFIGTMLTSAISQTGAGSSPNPMLSIILLFIGFLSTFIGNISVAGIYNLFFSKKYYDGTKTFGLLLLTNGLLFFILAPMYFVFASQIQSLFLVLGFHILFSVFVSACQIEFTANPNYSGSSLMGNIIGFAGSFLVYSLFYKSFTMSGGVENQTYLIMLLPPVLAYALIPFGAGIREKIYYKLYEMGSNAFYIPSPSDAQENQDPEQKAFQEESEINIDS